MKKDIDISELEYRSAAVWTLAAASRSTALGPNSAMII